MTGKRNEAHEPSRNRGLVSCSFDQIDSPGLYVDQGTGTLLRIPDDAVAPGRSPVLELVSKDPWTVTKISDDAFLPLTKARMLAADLDLYVNF